jgi:phosphoribosylaminoimidazole-succinocarboxamide synthase
MMVRNGRATINREDNRMDIVLHSEIHGLNKIASGKVRDIYDMGSLMLIVATDRISAYDSIMPNGIPDKGKVLTQLSRYWFLQLRPFMPNHYITTDMQFISAKLEEHGVHVTADLRRQLDGRSMLVLKAEVYPVECVVRGYLAGSLWTEYVQAGGETKSVVIHGIPLPGGLKESDRLPEPIFTPATKATTGHDENIGMKEMSEILNESIANELKEASLNIYKAASQRARDRGVIIADTKFEFGAYHGAPMLVDEVLTPDSSRFWDAHSWIPGKPQPSFDKQYVRDWLTSFGWNREPPAPELPEDVVRQTAQKYREAYRRITGENLD